MTKVLDSQAFVDLGLRLMAEGTIPAKVTQLEASAKLGVTKGSFTNYFERADLWFAAILKQWSADRRRDREVGSQYVALIRDPFDRIRAMRRAAAESAATCATMRDWAASGGPGSAAAEQALSEVRDAVRAELHHALRHIGLAPGEPDVMTEVLLREFGSGPGHPSVPIDDAARFDVLLGVIARSVQDPRVITTQVGVDGDAPASVFLFVAQPNGGAPIDPTLAADAAAWVRARLPALQAASEDQAPAQANHSGSSA